MRKILRQFLQLESSSGVILFVMALFAMVWANSPLAFIQQRFINVSLFWINEGLMTIFFLLVGLELKRGFIEGEFSNFSQILLPAAAALGGMLIPAFAYLFIAYPDAAAMKGWATPVATDIAFALGVLSLFGKRVPLQLKLFLLALAIFDDIGAILIIGFFHSTHLSYVLLLQAFVLVWLLRLFNKMGIGSLIPYFLIGILLWIILYYAGVHPTISGVLLALMIQNHPYKGKSLLHYLEETLHPWVAYFIMPIFALANAGFSLQGFTWTVLTEKIVLGITLGLFLGKQVGVMGFSWIMIRLGFARLPERCTWLDLYGVSLLCGIGFTMSLFLGTLSFQNQPAYLTTVRLGVIFGSVLSGLLGSFILHIALDKSKN